MPLTDLNHFLVLAKDIDASRRFYIEALGMRDAPRPWAPFPGAWLAIGSQVCLHLAQANDDPEMLHHFGRSPGEMLHGSAAVDHIAFYASDLEEFEHRLEHLAIPYRRRSIPKSSLEQIFVEDPDGVTIELNFPIDAIGSATGPLSQSEQSALKTALDEGASLMAQYGLAGRIAQEHLSPVVFSINARVGHSMLLERVYSSDEHAYPIGGRKNKDGTHFGRAVLLNAGILSSEGADAIRSSFDDSQRILDLGGRSVLNVPVISGGTCVGVLNAVLPDSIVPEHHVQLMQALADFLARGLRPQANDTPDQTCT